LRNTFIEAAWAGGQRSDFALMADAPGIRDLSNDAADNPARSVQASQQLSALSQNLAALVGRFRA